MSEVTNLSDFDASELSNLRVWGLKSGTPWTEGLIPVSDILAGLSGSAVSEQTGTTYTLATTDANTAIECNNASAITVTVPEDLDVPVGSVIEIHQSGAGVVTLSPENGNVTIKVRSGFDAKTAGQEAIIGIKKMAANVYRVTGDLGATA